MKKQPSKNLVGDRVALAATDDKSYSPETVLRKRGGAQHVQGHHELIPTVRKGTPRLHVPQLKQKAKNA